MDIKKSKMHWGPSQCPPLVAGCSATSRESFENSLRAEDGGWHPGLCPVTLCTPPADREFIEARRRALKRFVNLVARHPVFSKDVLLKLFLSFSGSDVQNKLRESAQCVGDEFMNCKLATRAKDFLPADIQAQFAISLELIRNIYNSFHKHRDRAERIASRAIDNAADLLIFGKELSAIGSDTTPLPALAALNSSTWGSLKQALKGLSVEFALLADKAAQQGKQEENDVLEELNFFLDLLQSYKDLCERHEKGVLHKHQRALHKYSLVKKQMMSAAVHNSEPESVEQLESRIVEQENAIQTMELRNYFSLYCLHQETQLIHVYLFHEASAYTVARARTGSDPTMSKVWNDLRPKLSCLFAGPHSVLTPPHSPPQSLPAAAAAASGPWAAEALSCAVLERLAKGRPCMSASAWVHVLLEEVAWPPAPLLP
ncbi:sorting nexin-8 [Cebus imitator]|uniref:sorting nexin-8 n=1 Tax=Cebus imitator TaxID=2715852 RepID=UPI0018983016|nr:sorting nexin-8 [Cebus imitator]